ncbi:GNAT family protein [Caenibius sp. WL]|uniref:GNAT family N-acetyltransferase n=1 Tax=Caenibius sp. WL TaxID=2872646 RepID=UPI001C99F170|nr:GNAT family protein [Caenibius sp. WL]QZP08548.1 GNAT family N-acetyltransferase [Caenibius sp. WL]
MNRQPVLEGERLLLRPLRPDDWAALYGVASDSLIWALHPAHDRWREPVFRAFFDDALAHGGALAAIDKASGALIGSSRFQNHDCAGGGSVEIGWTFLARSHWGGAWNRAMKRLMIGHALGAVAQVRFVVGADNLRSRRAMEKIGGHLTGVRETRMMAGMPVEHVHYAITRASFAAGPLA